MNVGELLNQVGLRTGVVRYVMPLVMVSAPTRRRGAVVEILMPAELNSCEERDAHRVAM